MVAHPEPKGAAWAGAGAGGRAGTPPAEAAMPLAALHVCRRRAARPSPVSRTLLRAERAERRGR